MAEDYHQKFYFRRDRELFDAIKTSVGSEQALFASTAAARANGFYGGYVTADELIAELRYLDIPPTKLEKIEARINALAR